MNKHESSQGMPEMFDRITKSGVQIGGRVDKATAHQLGLWHRDVHVWVTNGTHLLEQQRAWDKSIMPGAWDISVGGHVSAGETCLDTAVRETEEELGLSFEPSRFIAAGIVAAELIIEGWSEPHRTVGENYVVLEPDLDIDRLVVPAREIVDLRLYEIDQLAVDVADPETAGRHAPQPPELWALGIAAMRDVIANS